MQGLKRNGCLSIRTERGFKGRKVRRTTKDLQAREKPVFRAILALLGVKYMDVEL